MNVRSRIGIALALAAFASAAVFAQDAPIVAESSGIKLSIIIKGDNAEITVSAPVRGWVSVGFDPTNMMKDANFLIGYVKNGTAAARDDFGVGPTSHQEDARIGGKDNLVSFTGTEANGYTTMTFVIPRDSGDPKDRPLSPGPHKVILGASDSDSFTAFHKMVGRADIVIP